MYSTVDSVRLPGMGLTIDPAALRIHMKKEEEIAKLLSQGTPPVELIERGFVRGTVYKIAKRLAEKDAPQVSADQARS